jgi:hypothetical protein
MQIAPQAANRKLPIHHPRDRRVVPSDSALGEKEGSQRIQAGNELTTQDQNG